MKVGIIRGTPTFLGQGKQHGIALGETAVVALAPPCDADCKRKDCANKPLERMARKVDEVAPMETDLAEKMADVLEMRRMAEQDAEDPCG